MKTKKFLAWVLSVVMSASMLSNVSAYSIPDNLIPGDSAGDLTYDCVYNCDENGNEYIDFTVLYSSENTNWELTPLTYNHEIAWTKLRGLVLDWEKVKTINGEEVTIESGWYPVVQYYIELGPFDLCPAGKQFTFQQLIEMDDSELMNISETYNSIISNINLSGVNNGRILYSLNYSDISKYLNDEGDILKEEFIEDLGIPDGIIYSVSGIPQKSNINGQIFDTVHLNVNVKGYQEYSIYEVVRTVELLLRTNSDISYVQTEYSGRHPYDSDCKNGDLNADNVIDISDLSELSLALLGDKTLTPVQKVAADIDGDGEVTIVDLARLVQYVSKSIEEL